MPTIAPHALVLLCSAASFLGAGLIFWIEPLYAKLMLPQFGGSPAVWITALMFYQCALLAGYAYSHALARLGRPRRQAVVHLAVLAVAGLAGLPPALPAIAPQAFTAAPVTAVLSVLTLGLGLPLVALSATAPLLQRWFAQTGHPAAADPYFLYAASNAGSLLALLAFPLLLEPLLGLSRQLLLWSIGFVVLALLLPLCALPATRPPPPAPRQRAGAALLGRWVVLAAVPSSLLSGVTLTITTDVASAPLLWTLPLALYLLTFILAFSRRPLLPQRWALAGQALFLVALAAPSLIAALAGAGAAIAGLLAGFFFSALVCHHELAQSRPPVEKLTLFYLALAAGGLLGGGFNAVVAPSLFTGIAEWPLAVVAAVALRPGPWALRDLLVPLGGVAVAVAVLLPSGGLEHSGALVAAAAVLALAAVVAAARPLPAAGLMAAAFLLPLLHPAPVLFAERNFFGVVRVVHSPAEALHTLKHGTTVHGQQSRDPARIDQPLTYYHPDAPLGWALASLPETTRGRAAVIGLGAGSVACYLRQAESVVFYEIDPSVVAVATRPEMFSFLSRCRPDAVLDIGDGRLRLTDNPQRHSLIILDAFSSDAIPVHLLTREALRLYAAKLAPDGLLMVHFTNRHLDLAPVIGALARAEGLAARARCGEPDDQAFHSCWAALAPQPQTLSPLAATGWSPLAEDAEPWTDDFSDLVTAFLRRLAG